MKLFQWAMRMVKDGLLLPVQILRQAWKRVRSGSSLQRENHELLYQVTTLKLQNEKLLAALEAARDENVLLWQHMDEMKEAERLDKILQPVHHSMFVESNPSPVKYAAKLLGLCDDNVRLPLVKVTETTKEIVKKTLQLAKLI